VKVGKVSIAVKTFGVCDFSRLAVTDWRLRRWRWWFLALMTATQQFHINYPAVYALILVGGNTEPKLKKKKRKFILFWGIFSKSTLSPSLAAMKNSVIPYS